MECSDWRWLKVVLRTLLHTFQQREPSPKNLGCRYRHVTKLHRTCDFVATGSKIYTDQRSMLIYFDLLKAAPSKWRDHKIIVVRRHHTDKHTVDALKLDSACLQRDVLTSDCHLNHDVLFPAGCFPVVWPQPAPLTPTDVPCWVWSKFTAALPSYQRVCVRVCVFVL